MPTAETVTYSAISWFLAFVYICAVLFIIVSLLVTCVEYLKDRKKRRGKLY